MLNRLFIKNFAIIEEQEICFSKGLNIITGETGAGKSIIVDALSMLLGDRASNDYIRQGESKAIIEAEFLISDTSFKSFIIDLGYDFDSDSLIIRRELSAKGNSRSFLNDTPIQLNFLKDIGKKLVDFHGQHEHQSLLDNENHIHILDLFVAKHVIDNYKDSFILLKNSINQLNSLKSNRRNILTKIELYKLHIEEIESIMPEIGEVDKIQNELKILENAEELIELTNSLSARLIDSDHSIYNQLIESKKIFEKLSKFDNEFDEYMGDINSATIAIKEISSFVSKYSSNIDFNPEHIEKLRLRLLQLKGLQKKFGSIEETIKYYEQIKNELDNFENFDDKISELEQSIDKLSRNTGKSGFELYESRQNSAHIFSRTIESSLNELGIENAVFQVNSSLNSINQTNGDTVAIHNNKYYKANENGIEDIEFFISTNKGELPTPLKDTASGGEISRIMLSIKGILAGKDNIPTMIFDEIDTGISGRIAQKVGLAMRKLAQTHQIISITHLPQIAAMGDRNIFLEKIENEKRTTTNAKVLGYQEKIHEIAKMLSGENVSLSALKSAEELITNNN